VLAPALLVLGLLIVAYPPGELERSLASFLASFPGWLDPVWQFVYDLLPAYAALLLLVALVARRWGVVLEALGSVALALLIGVASAPFAAGLPDLGEAIGGSDATAFPAFRLLVCATVILAIGAELVRPLRSLGRWVVGIGFGATLLTAAALPSGAVAALAIAVAAGAGLRLAVGTIAGQPGVPEVAAALAELGVTVVGLEPAAQQDDEAFLAHGRDSTGRELAVKVYGRDAYTDQLLTKCWRAVTYRQSGPGPRVSRSQAAEHEAFMTLLAHGGGVPSREVVTAGVTRNGDAVLVLAGAATPLDTPSDDVLGEAWQALSLLSEMNIAHLRIDPTSVVAVDGSVGLVDFAAATVSPSTDQRLADRAALLATTASAAGVERAVSAALGALGTDGVTELLPYLQPAAFSPSLRQALKRADIKTDRLLEQAAAAVAAEPPPLLKLRRVTWKSLLQVALLLFAASAIASAVTGIDLAELRQSFESAAWEWIVAGFIVAQLPRVTLALSTMGSLVAKLRFVPVWVKQLSEPYLSLAIPSGGARMALSIRFFQRQGVPPHVAVASGAIESLGGNFVQVVLLVSLLCFSEATLAFDLSAPSASGMRTLLVLFVAVVIACVGVFALVPRLRHAITDRVRRWWPDIRETLGTLRTPNKIGLVLVANVATEVLWASTLGLFAHAFGSSIPLTELLVINISISLLGSFVPVPGGIGVIEWGLTVGLTAAGMSETAAFATVFCHRVATFYLPSIGGFFAMRWLQRNRYL